MTRRPSPLHRRGARALLLAGLIAGCGSAQSSSPGGSGGAPATLTIAVTGPMQTADGEHMRQGADLAVRQVNDAGGIRSGTYRGAHLAVTYLDDSDKVPGSVTNANRAVSDQNTWALLGSGFSDGALAIAPVTDRAGVTFMSTYASDDAILATPRRNVFVVPPTFPAYAYSAAERVHALGWSRAALVQTNLSFSTDMGREFGDHLRDLGGSVVDTETYEYGTKDFQTLAAKIKGISPAPDVIAVAGLTDADTAQLTALRAAGVSTPVIDLEAVLYSKPFLQAAGANAEGVVGQTPSDPQRNTAPASALRSAFSSAYGTTAVPDPAAFTYEAVLVLARAFETSPADRSQLAAAVRAVSIDDTGVGRIAFDASGARVGGILWYFTVKGGDFHFDTGYQQTAPRQVREIALQH